MTAVSELLATDALNAWVADGISVTLAGVKATLTGGTSNTVPLAEAEKSTTLVAVTVIDCAVLTEAGAVYKPVAEMVPMAGLRAQVTVALEDPLTTAVKAWLCDDDRATAAAGLSETLTEKIEYAPTVTMLLIPPATAIARMVMESDTVRGPEYNVEVVEGVLPSVV
jgi:hypothetical protein